MDELEKVRNEIAVLKRWDNAMEVEIKDINNEVEEIDQKVNMIDDRSFANLEDIAALAVVVELNTTNIGLDDEAINQMKDQVNTISGTVDDHTTSIGDNASAISDLGEVVDGHTTLIGNNTSAINDVVSDVATNVTNIGSNTEDITENRNNIVDILTQEHVDLGYFEPGTTCDLSEADDEWYAAIPHGNITRINDPTHPNKIPWGMFRNVDGVTITDPTYGFSVWKLRRSELDSPVLISEASRSGLNIIEIGWGQSTINIQQANIPMQHQTTVSHFWGADNEYIQLKCETGNLNIGASVCTSNGILCTNAFNGGIFYSVTGLFGNVWGTVSNGTLNAIALVSGSNSAAGISTKCYYPYSIKWTSS